MVGVAVGLPKLEPVARGELADQDGLLLGGDVPADESSRIEPVPRLKLGRDYEIHGEVVAEKLDERTDGAGEEHRKVAGGTVLGYPSLAGL